MSPKPSTTSCAVKPQVLSFLLDITSLPRQALQTTTDLKLNSVSDSTNGFAHWGPSKPPPPVSIETPSPHRPHPLVAIETMPTLSFEGPPPSLATWDTTCFMKPSSCAISPCCSAEGIYFKSGLFWSKAVEAHMTWLQERGYCEIRGFAGI